jgi:hypothetical protein
VNFHRLSDDEKENDFECDEHDDGLVESETVRTGGYRAKFQDYVNDGTVDDYEKDVDDEDHL